MWSLCFSGVFADNSTPTSTGNDNTIEIKVTQKVPGAQCDKTDWETLYTCTITPWFSSIMLMIGNFIKYFTAITALAGVLFLVINGIMLSMWGLDSEAKQRTKDFITRTILWLLLLIFTWVFLRILAPWVYN